MFYFSLSLKFTFKLCLAETVELKFRFCGIGKICSRSKEFNVTCSRMRPSNRGIDNAIKNSLLDSLIKSLGCSAEFVITCWKFAAAFAHTFAALYSYVPSLSHALSSVLVFPSSHASTYLPIYLRSSQRPRVSLFRQFPRACRRQMPTSPSFSV